MNAWYDIKEQDISERTSQDGEAIMMSAEYLKSLAFVTTQRYRIPTGRVVYSGFSQGAAISLAAGLTARIAPAGIAALSGYLAGASEVLARLCNKTAPILMCHGTQDKIIPFFAAERTKDVLGKAGVANITLKSYTMEHSACQEEINDFAAFLQKVLP
uniref:Putative lysophospholipase n=1 Tax=Trypanosoma vivax (strain Y486) TaxID=1055687 RepID=G0U1N4_TRYVY|nr:putative lysophospholipase [Trypanosoma vivax Y486]